MKIYVVEILTGGQWNNVVTGIRIFLSRIEAYNFYLHITNINKCEAKLYRYHKLSGTCFGEEKRIK